MATPSVEPQRGKIQKYISSQVLTVWPLRVSPNVQMCSQTTALCSCPTLSLYQPALPSSSSPVPSLSSNFLFLNHVSL